MVGSDGSSRSVLASVRALFALNRAPYFAP